MRLRSGALVVAALSLGAVHSRADAPRVKTHGQATVEYRDDHIRCVAAYDYSQRHHNGQWLLIDVAIKTADRFVIHRREFKIVSAEKREIALASQQQYLEDAQKITSLQQNARIWKRPLDVYFTDPPLMPFRFFALPGDGTVVDEMVVGEYGASPVSLYFATPGDHWEKGTYQLVIDGGRVHASLPLELR